MPPCPLVYTYSLPPPLQDLSAASLSLDAAFGPPIAQQFGVGVAPANLRETEQYALAAILLHRLTASRCRTANAAEADVFFVPLLAKAKTGKEWDRSCAAVNESLLLAHLPHLNEETACRHFFVVSKGHYNARRCDWWRQPGSLLARATRFSYTFALDEAKLGSSVFRAEPPEYLSPAFLRRERGEYSNLQSVPYPSNLHWSGGTDPMAHFMRNKTFYVPAEPAALEAAFSAAMARRSPISLFGGLDTWKAQHCAGWSKTREVAPPRCESGARRRAEPHGKSEPGRGRARGRRGVGPVECFLSFVWVVVRMYSVST